MKNTPTALELIRNKFPNHDGIFVLRNIEEFMVEFAKLHVENQAKILYEKSKNWKDASNGYSYQPINEDSILNAYPLDNIK